MLNTGMVDIQHDVMQTCVNFLGFPAQARSVLRHFQARCCYTASISRFTRCKQYACLLEQFSRFDGGRHICPFGDGFNAIGDKLMRGVNIQFVLGGARQGDINWYRPRLLAFEIDQTKFFGVICHSTIAAGFDFDKTRQFLFRESAFINYSATGV
ncbi:hypothetical protein ESCOCP365M1_20405 [Escherichia coli]